MAVTSTEENTQHFEPHVVYVVSVDDDAAIANMERDSLSIELNEETASFEPHSARNIITSATTSQPMLSFTLARSEASEAMDTLGIRDDTNDGVYVRGTDREKSRMELWYYADDADPTADNPVLVDAFGDCRIDVSTVSTDEITADLEVEIQVNGDVWFDTTSDLVP